VVTRDPPNMEMLEQYLKLGHDHFLRDPFQVIIHQST
jgi:hypothetical protein